MPFCHWFPGKCVWYCIKGSSAKVAFSLSDRCKFIFSFSDDASGKDLCFLISYIWSVTLLQLKSKNKAKHTTFLRPKSKLTGGWRAPKAIHDEGSCCWCRQLCSGSQSSSTREEWEFNRCFCISTSCSKTAGITWSAHFPWLPIDQGRLHWEVSHGNPTSWWHTCKK